MKVRDLRQYITTLCGGIDTIDALGTKKEYFLEKMSGAMKTVNSLIVGAASFANNAKEQLFYEFVQNAYDANADSLFFYANEEYLIVLNNGEPFYTDLDILEIENPRDGQLYNFLAKGQSLKLEDEGKLGKHGQGSKLLYTLLADVDNNAKTEELLKDTIIKNRKGPYLISWSNKAQLDALLINGDDWVPSQADNIDDNILFAKILMSYYPVAPGQCLDFFTNEEAQNAVRAFELLVDPRRNMHFLTRGTALIIPLGKGKYESIVADSNLQNVRSRLGGFASITADLEHNRGKCLKHIYVMGEEIEQLPVQSLFLEYDNEGRTFEYHFAFNPAFSEKNVVNFFQGLPILQTKYRLGFIIDSKVFDIDDSRQRITDTDKTGSQLRLAFSKLIERLEELRTTDREKFDYIYKSILASKLESGIDEAKYVRDAFYDTFRPFFDKNAPTAIGTYVDFSCICEQEKEVDIQLSDIGINDKFWVDYSLLKEYKFHFTKEIETYSFKDMLCDADTAKLSQWIKLMSLETYKLFHSHCLDCVDDIETLKVFRSDKGNLFSIADVRSDSLVFYTASTSGLKFPGQEYIIEALTDTYSSEDALILYKKVKTNLEHFRSSDVNKETACNILVAVNDISNALNYQIKHEIALFQNWQGEYVTFSELLSERPEGTILFDTFTIKGYTPSVIKEGTVDWVVKPGDMWPWLNRNLSKILALTDWPDNAHKYLSDIKKVFIDEKIDSSQKISVYLDDSGKPTDTACHYLMRYGRKLDISEYQLLADSFKGHTFVPYQFEKELTEAPFTLPSLSVDDLLSDGIELHIDILKILATLHSDLLGRYRIIGTQDTFKIFNLDGGRNYLDNVSNELRKKLVQAGFYYVPEQVQALFASHNNYAYYFKTNTTLASKVIERLPNTYELLPVIKDCNADIINQYLDSINEIAIDNHIEEDDIRWQLIQFAVSRSSDTKNYIEKFKRAIKHKNEKLPNTIKSDSITSSSGVCYNLYELNKEYKQENELVDSFFSCLPSEDKANWFKTIFYSDAIECIDEEDLYEDLKTEYLSVEQLRFCLDYSLHYSPEYDSLEIDDDDKLGEAMDMIKANAYYGFDKYFKIEGFNPAVQAYADYELLTQEEHLPVLLHNWLKDNPDGVNLFSTLRTSIDPYIAIRSAVKNGCESVGIPSFSDSKLTDLTISWLLSSNIVYLFDSVSYKQISMVIEHLPEEFEPKVFLRYTGKIEELSGGVILPTFTLEKYQPEAKFLSWYNWTYSDTFKELLKSNVKLQQFFANNRVFCYGQQDMLVNHQLGKAPRIEIAPSAINSSTAYKEFSSPPYDKWKLMPESKGIVIYLSKEPIGVNFVLRCNGETLFSTEMRNREYGYEANKYVVVQYPNAERLTPLKTIEKYIAEMNFFKEPFIILQGLYVEQFEQLETMAEEKGLDIHSLVETADSKSENQEQGYTYVKMSENLSKESLQKAAESLSDDMIDNIETLRDIAENLSPDELQELAENKDKLLEMLADLNDEDESQESQVRQIIGYIGELIYEQYLKETLKVDYEFSADKGVGEYDFKYTDTDGHTVYVDVKTNLYSLKDGNSPFYLHRTQNGFMHENPQADYRIVRISLKDLHLDKGRDSYSTLRDVHGKDQNPRDNSRLKDDCRKLAAHYWKHAQIEEFTSDSPEYAIRIERRQ